MATTSKPAAQTSTEHGLEPRGRVHWNPTTSLLYTHAILRGDGMLAEGGPLMVDTGEHTGRSPQDRFLVREPSSEERINWGKVNQALRRGAVRRPSREGRRASGGERPLRRERVRRRRSRAPAPAARRSRTAPGTRSSRRRSSSSRPRRSSQSHHPEALVLHAPSVEADPDGGRDQQRDVRRPASRPRRR